MFQNWSSAPVFTGCWGYRSESMGKFSCHDRLASLPRSTQISFLITILRPGLGLISAFQFRFSEARLQEDKWSTVVCRCDQLAINRARNYSPSVGQIATKIYCPSIFWILPLIFTRCCRLIRTILFPIGYLLLTTLPDEIHRLPYSTKSRLNWMSFVVKNTSS